MAEDVVHTIGDYIYRSSDDLGKGSYGEVYKCRHKVSNFFDEPSKKSLKERTTIMATYII